MLRPDSAKILDVEGCPGQSTRLEWHSRINTHRDYDASFPTEVREEDSGHEAYFDDRCGRGWNSVDGGV